MLITRRVLAVGFTVCAMVMTSPFVGAVTASALGNPYLVKTWTSEQGLPQSSVIALTQTHDGYLWMGTLNGLVRFDGRSFTVFDESNTPGLASGQIVYLFEDSRTNLWVGTETAGILLIRGGQIVPLDIGHGSREGRLVSATEDAQGAVWLYTADGELCRYLGGMMETWKVGANHYSPSRTVIAERGGLVWAGMRTNQFGLGRAHTNRSRLLPLVESVPVAPLDFLLASQSEGYWRLANGRIEKRVGTDPVADWGPYPWKDTLITTACEDSEGNLIVGTRGAGVYWFDPTGQPTRIPGLSSDTVLSLCFDREGDLWVGTDGGGLNRVRRSEFTTLPGTEGWVVQSVAADADGGIWLGCNGGELAYWRDNQLKSYTTSEDLPSIKSVLADASGDVWVGTWGRGLYELESDTFRPVFPYDLLQSAVVALHESGDEIRWAGLQEGLVRIHPEGFRMFRTGAGLTQNAVRAIAEDDENTLWIGTAGGGLIRFREGAFAAYRKAQGQLPSDHINALHMDADGVLWIATGGGGLVRFHRNNWHTFSKLDGLPSNTVGYLFEDRHGFLWIGSNAGLLRVSKTNLNGYAAGETNRLQIRAYRQADGLPTSECTFGSQPAVAATPDGRLWFPTIKGLVTVDPTRLRPNPIPPPVTIESLRVDEQEQITNALRSTWPARVTLAPGTQLLEIGYTSLNLATRDRAQFRYRLEGHDATWINVGSDQIARYPRLPPGAYTFRVTAANEDGLWNDTGASLPVIVLPPFWRTWWFLALTVVLLVAMIAGTVYFISTQRLQRQVALLRQQEALERERARIARDLHDQLGANLTQISLLGELAEADKDAPGEVEEHARQISGTARETTHALDEIVWAANPSNDTLEGLVNYVCKYAQEYLALAKLRYRLDVPSPLPAVTLPPELRHNVFLAAKEAVNNVVKHAQATEARVSLQLLGAGFTLEIADNGRGPAGTETKAARSRNGLRNMRKRMTDIGGSFLMDTAPGGGSIVRLTVPLKDH